MLVSMVVRQQASPTVKTQNHDDLVALKGLVEAGTVTPVIDRDVPAPRHAGGDRPCRRGARPRDGRHHRRAGAVHRRPGVAAYADGGRRNGMNVVRDLGNVGMATSA